MLLIVEVLMLITGLWAIVTGQLPEKLFKLLFGKGEYQLDSRNVRFLGLLLASPIPLTFLGGLIIGILFGGEGVASAFILELLIVITVFIISVIIVRKIKNKPSELPPESSDRLP